MKFNRLAVALVVLLTMSSLAVAAAPTVDGAGAATEQSMVTLTVTVTDNFNNGISDAKLTASWDGGSNTARTASNGKAFLDVRKGADVEISIDHGAYTRNNPVIVEDASEQDLSIVVSRKGEARVTVVDEGSTVQDAQVVLYKEGQDRAAARGQTGSDGVFSSDTIERGDYRLIAVKEGYLRNETSIAVRDTTETTVSLTEGTVTVDVTVEDDNFDPAKAIEGVQIAVEGPTSATLQTSGSGTGTIGLPVNADYTITVTKDGYTTKSRTVQVGESSRSLSFTISREDALTVEAVNQRVVVGENVQLEVTDEYGNAVEGASISVDGETVGETDAEGVYRASIDSEGSHAITAEADGVTSSEVTVEGVSSGGATPGGEQTDTSEDPNAPPELPDFSQPTSAMKIGAAAAGVLLAFLFVRRLL